MPSYHDGRYAVLAGPGVMCGLSSTCSLHATCSRQPFRCMQERRSDIGLDRLARWIDRRGLIPDLVGRVLIKSSAICIDKTGHPGSNGYSIGRDGSAFGCPM